MNDEQLEANAKSTAKLKRTILIIFAAMVAFVILSVPLLRLLNGTEKPDEEEAPTYKPAQAIWEEPDWGKDIMKDKEYLGLNRQIMFEDRMTGVGEVMEARSKNAYGEGAALLYDMIQSVIGGDADTYNSFFSQSYLKKNGEKEDFTMQQVYEVTIIRYDQSTATEKGKAYTQYKFGVKYKINRNDGTFRTDIADGECWEQIFILTEREGRLLIESVTNV